MWVVTEYHQLGSLQAVLKREDPLSEEQAFSLGYNFIKGEIFVAMSGRKGERDAARDFFCS